MPSPPRSARTRPFLLWGVPLLISIPITSRRLPPRLSGFKRKNYNYAAFVAHSWKHLARKKLPSVTLSAEAFAEYIGSIDDLIDQVNSPSTSQIRHYQANPILQGHMSRFVRGVKRTELSSVQKRAIFKIAGNFRRAAWKTLQRFEKEPGTLENVLRLKEETSGEYGRVIASILNVGGRVPRERRKSIEDAFTSATMALQVYDDLFDIHEDHRQKTPNIVLSILQKHPEEYQRFLSNRKPRSFWLKRYCPRSYAEVEEILLEYLSRIPTPSAREMAFKSLPRILWVIGQIRRG